MPGDAPPVSHGDLGAWADLAERLAVEAGRCLLDHAARLGTIRTEFKGRRELVTVADRAAEDVIVRGLLEGCPEHAILAEEGVHTPQGLVSETRPFTWIIDPLDGTTNFVHGLPIYCVAIGLAHEGKVVLGVVHAPVLGKTYRAIRGGGATCNGDPIRVTETDEVADALVATGFAYDRNEPGHDDNVAKIQAVLPACRDLRRMGSAELDLCHVAAGHYDGYWEMYLQPYDVAAGAVIVEEAGGRVTDLAGGDDWLFGGQVLATNGRVHDELRRLVGAKRG